MPVAPKSDRHCALGGAGQQRGETRRLRLLELRTCSPHCRAMHLVL